METVSDNSGKRGRGRPRKFPQQLLDDSADEHGQDMDMRPYYYSNRQKQNIVYAERARERLVAFGDEGQPEHFGTEGDVRTPLTPRADWATSETQSAYTPQRVLTELGRCLDSEAGEGLFWRMVDWYAERGYRHTAAYAARHIRDERIRPDTDSAEGALP